jgi:hypothetical protein
MKYTNVDWANGSVVIATCTLKCSTVGDVMSELIEVEYRIELESSQRHQVFLYIT